MASVNKVILMGNLGRDPELKQTKSGLATASASLATTKRAKDGQDVTEWHNLSFFGRTAEIVAQYCTKGSSIYVEGSLRYREWEKDGIKRKTTEIVVDNLQLIGGKSSAGNHQQSAPAQRQQQHQHQESFDPDDVPF